MPAKASKSSISEKYGNRLTKVLDQHATEEVNYGNRQLPPIRNGVAQLVEMYFAKQEGKDGKDFWRAAGSIVEPTEVINEGRKEKVKNRQTSMVIMISEDSWEKDIADIQMEMRKIGGPELFTANKGTSIEDLCAALVEAAPYFKFETSMSKFDPNKKNPKTGKPYEPRLWENWYGSEGLDNYSPPEDKNEAIDQTATANIGISKNGSASPTISKGKAVQKPAPAKKSEPEPEVQYSDDQDLTSLRDRAENQDDDEAKTKLFEFAAANGWSDEEMEAANWDELMEMTTTKKEEEETESGSDVREPKVKETPDYAPLDPKDKKKEKRLKPINCVVTKVDKKEFTCELANLADKKKVYKDVPWADLIWDS